MNSLPKAITCRDQDSNPSCLVCEPDALTTRPPRLTGLDITFSATQLSKQIGGFIGALLAGLAGTLLPTIISKITGHGVRKKGRGLVLPGTSR